MCQMLPRPSGCDGGKAGKIPPLFHSGGETPIPQERQE